MNKFKIVEIIKQARLYTDNKRHCKAIVYETLYAYFNVIPPGFRNQVTRMLCFPRRVVSNGN
jgi:hypothetical protein